MIKATLECCLALASAAMTTAAAACLDDVGVLDNHKKPVVCLKSWSTALAYNGAATQQISSSLHCITLHGVSATSHRHCSQSHRSRMYEQAV